MYDIFAVVYPGVEQAEFSWCQQEEKSGERFVGAVVEVGTEEFHLSTWDADAIARGAARFRCPLSAPQTVGR